jgi:hypothetical protein
MTILDPITGNLVTIDTSSRPRRSERPFANGGESWLGEFEQRDKWSFCLTVAKMAARQERP